MKTTLKSNSIKSTIKTTRTRTVSRTIIASSNRSNINKRVIS